MDKTFRFDKMFVRQTLAANEVKTLHYEGKAIGAYDAIQFVYTSGFSNQCRRPKTRREILQYIIVY